MRPTLSAALLFGAVASVWAVRAADGLIAVKSPHAVKETIDRFESAAKARNLVIFVRVDHGAGAQKIGRTLRPTELLIFGNPQGGTPFMECAQSIGIDLPLKALAWQDESGQVWLAYNDPQFLAARHGVPNCAVAPNLKKALEALAGEATKP
ncbi:MAG TPA: DUF302 domain-containing protein [Burkholderiales bacterium]|jgi:uncharacterized protein (DUF302 family)|nr:DUF302 domain-containing protein [Burkholderiales bacterium]